MFGDIQVIRPGANASVGVVGPTGKSLLGGLSPPSNTVGVDGDFFFDKTNANIYGPKAAGAWPSTYTSLIGPRGLNGPQILSGGGTPSAGIGLDGDYFLNAGASIFYGPKTAGAWPTPGISLLGNPGPATTITIGTVATLAPGVPATAALTGNSPNQALSLGIPQGPQGASGNGSGNVVGPSSSTNGHIALFNGATGTVLKDGIDPATLATAASVLTRGQIVALALGSPL